MASKARKTDRTSAPTSPTSPTTSAPAPETTAPASGGVHLSKAGLAIIMVCVLAAGVLVGTLFVPSTQDGAPTPTVSQQSGPAAPAQPQEVPIDTATQRRIDELARQVASNPGDRESFVQLGNLYFDTNQPRLAIQAYEAALRIRDDDANVLTDLGIMYRHEGQYEKALEVFGKASAVDPKHRNALFNTGIVLAYDLNRPAEAVAAWKNLLELYPNARTSDGQPLTALIAQFEGAGPAAQPQAAPAAQQPQAAPTAQAQVPSAGTSAGVDSARQARITELSRRVLESPSDRAAFVELGDLYFDTQQPALAIEAYEAALRLNDNDPDVITDMGVMYRNTGNSQKALECFQRASAMAPQHRQSLFNQGIVLAYDLGRPAEAVTIWEKLLAIDPDARIPGGTRLDEFIKKFK